MNFVASKFTGKKSEGGGEGGGDQPQLNAAPTQKMLGVAGDPTFGKRAPYTGTADGIGMGDVSGRLCNRLRKLDQWHLSCLV